MYDLKSINNKIFPQYQGLCFGTFCIFFSIYKKKYFGCSKITTDGEKSAIEILIVLNENVNCRVF